MASLISFNGTQETRNNRINQHYVNQVFIINNITDGIEKVFVWNEKRKKNV